ncbi:DNA processing protein DprA [Arthrobacter sp. Soil782]|uniref:DNA-processing protein DprA n=1 Tax=Arthrobacter sp. Soil782 TaxID=1736410 RepID=UPI0006FE8B53|nr:DNA-processing protein DprA [Arthrobacter sp. Soil782]KRF05821.1 DNA processing protein DprA [Arthrobacter sp. Soil782]
MTGSVWSEEQIARAALARLLEPLDNVGLALVAAAGPVEALQIATGATSCGPQVHRVFLEVLDASGHRVRTDVLIQAIARWQTRVGALAPLRDLETVRRFGGTLLIPESDWWPKALADLQLEEPMCLWVRGDNPVPIPSQERVVAVVGSRDSTSYGLEVTGDLAAGLVARGYTVVSGGAYGIDARAHRGALKAAREDHPLPTLSVLACGIDRYYPAGNEDLLREVARHGLLVSEVPPGSSPTRYRFLQRNRIIAALSSVTVVVEARWRSGALSTAHHAAGLGRSVGAVPGSVHSVNSAGCHRLLREGSAICVTDAAEVAELTGPLLAELEERREDKPALHDGLVVGDLLLLDALPVRSSSTVDKLATVAGLSVPGVLAGLGRLETDGLAQRTDDGGWRKGSR